MSVRAIAISLAGAALLACGSGLGAGDGSAFWQGVGTSWAARTCDELPDSAVLVDLSGIDRATLQSALETGHARCLER